MNLKKEEWVFDGNREEYCNKVMRYMLGHGGTLRAFFIALEAKGIELPPEVVKELQARLSTNPL